MFDKKLCSDLARGVLAVGLVFLPGQVACGQHSRIVAAGGKPVRSCAGRGALNRDHDLAGLVLNISGDWQVQSGGKKQVLKLGDSVPNGWTLAGSSPDGSITIVLTDGTKLQCPGNLKNNAAIVVSKKQSPASLWWAAAIGMFAQHPTEWVVAESRDVVFPGQEPALQDAVLKLEDGQLDLTPAIAASAPGTFFVRLDKIGRDGGALCLGPEPVQLNKERAVVSLPALKAGLYKVSLSSDKSEPAGDEAMVLVCRANGYDKNRLSFKTAVASCESLKTNAAPNAVRELLRAYLASMNSAMSQGTKSPGK